MLDYIKQLFTGLTSNWLNIIAIIVLIVAGYIAWQKAKPQPSQSQSQQNVSDVLYEIVRNQEELKRQITHGVVVDSDSNRVDLRVKQLDDISDYSDETPNSPPVSPKLPQYQPNHSLQSLKRDVDEKLVVNQTEPDIDNLSCVSSMHDDLSTISEEEEDLDFRNAEESDDDNTPDPDETLRNTIIDDMRRLEDSTPSPVSIPEKEPQPKPQPLPLPEQMTMQPESPTPIKSIPVVKLGNLAFKPKAIPSDMATNFKPKPIPVTIKQKSTAPVTSSPV